MKHIFLSLSLLLSAMTVIGQEIIVEEDTLYRPEPVSVCDSLLAAYGDSVPAIVSFQPLPRQFFLPAVFSTYMIPQGTEAETVFKGDYSGTEAFRWLEDANATASRSMGYIQQMAVHSPGSIAYISELLPEAVNQYTPVIDPRDFNVKVADIDITGNDQTTLTAPEVKKRHWIRTFTASLQFSQAYVSPNWYQGGNNNLNMLANIYYNVKLNQEFHPNILFETTAQYKLGMNSAPDDSLRSYNISDDLLQINTTFGLKAAKHWYYSFNAMFKTQLLKSYTSNTRTLRSAFLSPGELNAGIGMTYNYANAAKTVTFDASISPLSYNLMMCINEELNPTAFGIEEGRHTKNKFGSSTELKLMWKISRNIVYRSRLFGFTDYDRAYFDWENTLAFEINKFLTTQIFAHLRYDTKTPATVDEKWHKLQVKEILSIGFAYKFSTL